MLGFLDIPDSDFEFRIWDGTKMIPFSLWQYMGMNENGQEKLVPYEAREKYRIMRFTGLLDKLGNRIYEGDVFECPTRKNDGLMLGEIIFEDGGFKIVYGIKHPLEFERKGYFLSSKISSDIAKTIFVIGNAYANPELLKNSHGTS